MFLEKVKSDIYCRVLYKYLVWQRK